MAISYVGGVTLGRTNASAATSVSLTSGLTGGSGGAALEGDLVVVTVAVGTQARTPAIAVTTPSGYTALTVQQTTATTYDTTVQTSYKVMGSTPDTTVTVPGSANNADGLAYAIQVFRGVDGTTPMDTTATYATGSGTNNLPNGAAITPVTAGAWIVVCGGGAAATGGTYAAAALTNFLQANGADTNDGTVGAGYYTAWTSGAYDPVAFGGGSTNANNSWGATTIALRPAPEPATEGTISTTETTDTTAVSASVTTGAAIVTTETTDTTSATASVTMGGAIVTIETTDTAAVTATNWMTGQVATTETSDTTSITASTSSTTEASVAAVESSDTTSLQGLIALGRLLTIESSDTTVIIAANWMTAQIAALETTDATAIATTWVTGAAIITIDFPDTVSIFSGSQQSYTGVSKRSYAGIESPRRLDAYISYID